MRGWALACAGLLTVFGVGLLADVPTAPPVAQAILPELHLAQVSLPLTDGRGRPSHQTSTDWADCLSCHVDPGAQLPSLLDLRPLIPGGLTRRDCAECHTQSELLTADGNLSHPVRPVGSHIGCVLCHPAVPHGSSDPPPLPVGDYNASGCYECHADIGAQRRLTSAHREVGALQCRDCHPAHEPLDVALPLELLPTTLRTRSYDFLTSNRACLTCHSQAEIMLDLSSGFVELDRRNLHELHVVSGQSLCVECHEPHGSMTHGMLRRELLTGAPMIHRLEPQGASCATTCHGVEHAPLGYVNRRR